MLNAFSKGLAWYKFEQLEREFLEATLYFPFEKEHRDIWSEFFSDLIVKIGNSVDSFFRLMLKGKSFDSFPHVTELKKERRKRDITYFRDFFEPIYQLSSVEVQITHGPDFYEKRSYPFSKFENSGVPNWWTSYNHVKHEWFDRIREATLENTINALTGLFVLNILHKENQQYLIQHTDVISYDYPGKIPLKKYFMESMIGIPKSLSNWGIRAETPLFTHVFRLDEKAEGIPLYIFDEDE